MKMTNVPLVARTAKLKQVDPFLEIKILKRGNDFCTSCLQLQCHDVISKEISVVVQFYP